MTRVRAEQESGVLLWHLVRLIQNVDITRDEIVRDVLQRVIAQANLHGLVEEKHVDLIVP